MPYEDRASRRCYLRLSVRDGTLASLHNAPDTKNKEDWAAFNAALRFDSVNPVVAALLNSIRPGIVRIMVSGRMEGDWPGDRRRRFAMEDWIDKWNLPIDLLMMREGGDHRLDSVVKEEILVNKILPYYNVLMACDDRLSIVEVWRRYNIYTIQVKDPKIQPPIALQTPW